MDLFFVDVIIIPSFIIYASGLQRTWQFNSVFLPLYIGYSSYRDHYTISINSYSIFYSSLNSNLIVGLINTRYLIDISQYILSPIYSFIRLFVYAFDVIHTLGFYSWGIKIDTIPGRINIATTLRLLNKGEWWGKCFESRGQGHIATIIISIII